MILVPKKLFLVFASGVVAAWILNLTSMLLKNKYNSQSSLPSSVWCHLGPNREKLCRFRNICYDPRFKEFQFLMSEESVISGVQNASQWMDIEMSTVLGHNAFKMKLSLMSAHNKIKSRTAQYVKIPTFIIHRFKPDNIMHVIHDDLLPLYVTMTSILGKTAILKQKFALAFYDDYKQDVYHNWYQHFSGTPFIRLASVNETICFDDVYVGLYRTTLWFNYGFKQFQGSYINDNFDVQGVREFINFNLDVWHANSNQVSSFNSLNTKIIIFVRSQSRRILNLDVLKEAIKSSHRQIYPDNELEIVEIDLAVHETGFVLSQIRNAKLIVGMHGAALILSLFLPSSSAIVELFPFGINPENVSFLRALSKQHQALPINYDFWRNSRRENSEPGAQKEPLLGKISHLPVSEQHRIKNLSEVPAVHCCHDPAYLYYIYHDTLVSDDIFYPVLEAFTKTRNTKIDNHTILSHHIFPAFPSFLRCFKSVNLVSIEWGQLSNSEENVGLWFQITILSGEQVRVFNVSESALGMFSISSNSTAEAIHVWFQPFNYKNIGGLIKHKECVTNYL